MEAMRELAPWLTPALVIALFAWLRTDLRQLRREVNSRFDDMILAGRRDREAA